jgi:AcrR family transcriptional regulator
MWYMGKANPKQWLLEAVVNHALAHGIADQSLRAIARAAGTSHRMLIHHFGSREQLLIEVIKAAEVRQRQLLAALLAQPEATGEQIGLQLWDHLRDPAMHPQERLFFEVYGQALQGRDWARPVLEGIVKDWTGPIQRLLDPKGVDPATAEIDARLGLAVTRGLLLDLLATGEGVAVDAAMRRFVELRTAFVAASGSAPQPRRGTD